MPPAAGTWRICGNKETQENLGLVKTVWGKWHKNSTKSAEALRTVVLFLWGLEGHWGCLQGEQGSGAGGRTWWEGGSQPKATCCWGEFASLCLCGLLRDQGSDLPARTPSRLAKGRTGRHSPTWELEPHLGSLSGAPSTGFLQAPGLAGHWGAGPNIVFVSGWVPDKPLLLQIKPVPY